MFSSAMKINKLLNFVIGVNIFLFIGFIAIITWASFMPEQSFSVEKGIGHWSLSFDFSNSASFSALVPFSILQPISETIFSAKTAFLTFYISLGFIYFPLFIYGLLIVQEIVISTIKEESPFNNINAQRIKKIAYLLIGYSLFSDLLINFFMYVFVTNIFLLNISNVSFNGFVIGAVMLLIAHIFRYGSFLQQEHDETI